MKGSRPVTYSDRCAGTLEREGDTILESRFKPRYP
jgi:hypothetical protein